MTKKKILKKAVEIYKVTILPWKNKDFYFLLFFLQSCSALNSLRQRRVISISPFKGCFALVSTCMEGDKRQMSSYMVEY